MQNMNIPSQLLAHHILQLQVNRMPFSIGNSILLPIVEMQIDHVFRVSKRYSESRSAPKEGQFEKIPRQITAKSDNAVFYYRGDARNNVE
jgi:hypothetical protein